MGVAVGAGVKVGTGTAVAVAAGVGLGVGRGEAAVAAGLAAVGPGVAVAGVAVESDAGVFGPADGVQAARLIRRAIATKTAVVSFMTWRLWHLKGRPRGTVGI
ncbi:MAG: hypothetical protein BZY83_05810 [SAR202 cluster bacterium Casp-Chloro-G2]|nr:MAG: hypothetical protein BZY83_05810 [SAR202 cluster bacterium Casp-Chloro-G2]